MKVGELLAGIDELLEPSRFRDYCPNGLQVEGKSEVSLIVTGVTASLALIEAAIEAGADAILVHHGLFWRGDDMRVVGPRRERLARLLAAHVNLLAYHLPLDAHPEVGNNAQLGARLGLVADSRFGDQDIGFSGVLASPVPAHGFAARVRAALGRDCLLVGDPDRPVRRIGWCTGGAQGFLTDAVAAGCDLFLSGEISEQTTHLARETGVAYIAAGHHATERYGADALGQRLQERFGVAHRHIDIDNPA